MIPGDETQDEQGTESDFSDEFDFVEAYDEAPANDDLLLPENTATSAINCAFIGVGGGGGNVARAIHGDVFLLESKGGVKPIHTHCLGACPSAGVINVSRDYLVGTSSRGGYPVDCPRYPAIPYTTAYISRRR